MREAAAVTTPMCWSFKRWTMRDVHSPDEDGGWDEDEHDFSWGWMMRMSMVGMMAMNICVGCSLSGQYMTPTPIIYTKIVPSDIHLLLKYWHVHCAEVSCRSDFSRKRVIESAQGVTSCTGHQPEAKHAISNISIQIQLKTQKPQLHALNEVWKHLNPVFWMLYHTC